MSDVDAKVGQRALAPYLKRQSLNEAPNETFKKQKNLNKKKWPVAQSCHDLFLLKRP